jgi:hypothetical protein
MIHRLSNDPAARKALCRGIGLALIAGLALAGCAGDGSSTENAPITNPAPSPSPSPTPPPTGNPDATPPTVSITAPGGGTTVSGTITLGAAASNPTVSGQVTSGMREVRFSVDGASLGSPDSSAPYQVSWNTTSVANGTHTLTATAYDNANLSKSASITVTVSNVSTPPPSPPPPTSGAMPSLADEKAAYQKWGWSWSAGQEPGAIAVDPYTTYYGGRAYSVGNIDIHGDTEGDDLWTYIMMYRRTGNSIYLNRAQAWANYFKNSYRGSSEFAYDKGFLLDHLYGWGLIAWYEHANDAAALAEAENIAAEVESFWNQNPNLKMGEYGPRQGARHLLLATRVADITQKARWITLRDKLIDKWLATPHWDAARGMYFMGQWDTDTIIGDTTATTVDDNCRYTGAAGCPYASGARVQSPFQVGILVEAFYRAWLATGRTELRDRLIGIARFADQYGLDPTYQYTASAFGIVNGQVWHKYSANAPVTFWDPVYTTSLVNALVVGYKLTGERRLYDRAKYFFNRGTKGVYGSPTQRSAADNAVAHFVDTVFATSTGNFYLEFNKGELQYTYLLFENGGL